MRGVSTSVVISTIVLAFLVTFTTTAHSWTVTVTNATTCKIRVKIEYGALGRLIKEEYIAPNGTKTFDTGADCPLTISASLQQNNAQGTCNDVYSDYYQRCFWKSDMWGFCIHACFSSNWKINGNNPMNWEKNY